eukprot:jgi/Tetstr1/435073/TSEL_024042.t1
MEGQPPPAAGRGRGRGRGGGRPDISGPGGPGGGDGGPPAPVYSQHDIRSQHPPQPQPQPHRHQRGGRAGRGPPGQEFSHQPPQHGGPPRASEQPGNWGQPAQEQLPHQRPHGPRGAPLGASYQGRGGRAGNARRGGGYTGSGYQTNDARNGAASQPRDRPPTDAGGSPADGAAVAPAEDNTAPNKQRERGFVVTIRDSFGFISCVTGSEEVFFHISEVHPPEGASENQARHHMRDLVSEGTEVEFTIVPNPRSDRPNAKEVKILPAGTIQTHDEGEQVLTAVVTQEAQATARRDGAIGVLRVTGVAEGQPTEASAAGPSAAPGDTLLFELAEVADGAVPRAGSAMECRVAVHRRSRQRRAVGLRVTAMAEPPRTERDWSAGKPEAEAPPPARPAGQAVCPPGRDTGVVVTLKESFGFIKPVQPDAKEMFFHFSELPEGQRPGLGAVVEYEVQFSQRTKRDVAVRVSVLPEDALPLGSPQTVQGTVNILAGEASSGMLLFADPQLCEQTCSYATRAVDAGTIKDDKPLEADDEVEFEACVNLATGNYTATAVRLLRRASECVEYGAVNMLKAHFGFIKCCSRTLDAFFHFSSLKEGLTPETISNGTEVQFRLTRDRKTGKLNAADVAPAPPGAVVFEQLEEGELSGTVAERSYSKGVGGMVVGVIEYTDPGTAAPERMTFNLPDVIGIPPKIGDPVVFKAAVDLRAQRDAIRAKSAAGQRGARRAVQVALVRHAGRVAALRTSFGFIEYKPRAINLPQTHQEGEEEGGESNVPAPPGLTPVSSSSDATKAPGVEQAADDAGGEKLAAEASDGATEEKAAAAEEGGEGTPTKDGAAPEPAKADDAGEASPEAKADDKDATPAPATPSAEEPGLEAEEGGDDEGGEQQEGGKGRKGKGRVFFHFSEVQEGLTLGLSDEVEFTLYRNPKNKELNARHVVRTKAAPTRAPNRILEAITPPKHTPIRPGQPIRHQGVRQPLMPDDTRGFTYGRGKGLEGVVHPPLGLRPPPPLPEPEPELLERQDSALSLNADAAPFVPTFG